LVKQIEGEAPMFGKLEVTRMAQALAAHAGARQGVIAQNIAQADSPGYRARDLTPFEDTYRAGNQPDALFATRPGHIRLEAVAGEAVVRQMPGAASPNGNTVSLETEMVKAVDVKQQHDMALSIYRSVSEIIRASLGRR
jgi:flagellar basal-body rod protein FlgB